MFNQFLGHNSPDSFQISHTFSLHALLSPIYLKFFNFFFKQIFEVFWKDWKLTLKMNPSVSRRGKVFCDRAGYLQTLLALSLVWIMGFAVDQSTTSGAQVHTQARQWHGIYLTLPWLSQIQHLWPCVCLSKHTASIKCTNSELINNPKAVPKALTVINDQVEQP